MAFVMPTKVQSRSTDSTASSATLALAYTSNLGSGNLLIAVCIWNSASQTCTVASTGNSSWTAIGSPQRGTGNLAAYSSQMFYKANSTSGADTVTMTCSGSNAYRALAIHEFKGVDTSSPLEASTSYSNVTTSANIATSGTITTTNATDLLFGALLVDNSLSAVQTGWTLDENTAFGLNGTAHINHFSTGTYSVSWTTSATTNCMALLVAFKHTAPTPVTPNSSLILLQYNGGLLTRTASAATETTFYTGNSYEGIEIDTLVSSPNAIYYFEVIAKTSVSLANNVRLRCNTISGPVTGVFGEVAGVDIPTGTTSYTYFRSAYFTIPAGDKNDFDIIIGAGSGGTTSVGAWRICLLQGSGNDNLRSYETQIEIGDYCTITSTTLVPTTNPKFWTYHASNWDGQRVYWLSTAIAGTGGNVSVVLQEDNGSYSGWTTIATAISGTLSGGTWPIAKFNSPPTDGRHYRIAGSTSTGTLSIISAKILIDAYEGTTLMQPGTYGNDLALQGGTGASAETNQAWAQSFIITNSAVFTGCRLSLRKSGTPSDNVQIDIVSTLGGTSLATATLAASSLTTTYAAYDFSFVSNWTPTLNTTYYVQVTRTGARDTSNYAIIEGDTTFDDNIGQGSTRSNNAWATFNYDMLFRLLGSGGITKFEPQWVLIPNGDTGSTGLQNYGIKYDSSEWVAVNGSFYYAHDATNAADSSKLTVPPSTDITNATVTGANQQIAGTPFSMPADGTYFDTNVTNTTGIVTASRILYYANVALALSPAAITDSITVGESVTVQRIFDITVSDGITVGESLTMLETSFVNKTDAITLGETPNVALVDLINTTDAITLGESTTAARIFDITVSDGVTLGESQTMLETSFVAPSDAITVGEASNVATVDMISVSDALTLGEATIETLTDNIGVSDALTLGETLTATLTSFVNQTDAVTLGEAINRTLVSLVGVSDPVVVAETLNQTLVSLIGVSDGVTLGEATAELQISFVNVSEGITVGEAVTVQVVSAGQMLINVTDGLTVGEALAMLETSFVNLTDAITVGEVVNPNLVDNVTATDALLVGETLNQTLVNNVAVTDGITLADTVISELETSFINVTDGVTLGESVSLTIVSAGQILINVQDNVTVGEVVTVTISTAQINVVDAITVGETLAQLLASFVGVADAVVLADTPALSETNFVNVADNVSAGEASTVAIVSAGPYAINVTDGVILGETIGSVASLPGINVTDTVLIAEVVSALVYNFSPATSDIFKAMYKGMRKRVL